ncbi:MAG: hypothetical protein C9356_16290 [Oleiphilus sp.]|nr:MAG: hypothetical protein C9356_16290 [Oleiphilus sp.]
MHLNYKADSNLQQVLQRDERRIEFHVGRLNSELFAMITLSGNDQSRPDRIRLQGPYHALDQTRAAISAIKGILESKGYRPRETVTIWQLQAQAELNAARLTRQQHAVDTRFVPLGTPPEPKSPE